MENTIDLTPDEEIARFISSSYTDGYQTDLQNAISLLSLYGVPDVKEHLCGIIYAPESEDPDVAHSDFAEYIETKLYGVLEEHNVTLIETSLKTCNEVLAALYRIQHVEDPIPYLRILETNTLSNEEKFAKIISQMSAVTELNLFVHLGEIDDGLLERMVTQLTKLEAQDEANIAVADSTESNKLLMNLKLFFKHFGEDNLAHQIVTSGMMVGLPSKLYLAYFEDHLSENHPDTMALDLLGFFFLAEDTWRKPIEAYREISESIIHTPSLLIAIETKMGQLYETFTQFKDTYVAHSVPATQHPA